MGAIFETINWYGTGNGTLTTLNHGVDSMQVPAIRSTTTEPAAYMVALWSSVSAAADLTVHSPRMHDDIQAVHLRASATSSDPLAFECFYEPMYPQDTPIVQSVFATAPAAAAAQCVEVLNYYPSIGGLNAQLATYATIQPLVRSRLGIKMTITSGATAGTYGGGVTLNALEDFTKANSYYALLGYETSTPCASIGLLGPDIGNVIYAGPGTTSAINTRAFFYKVSANTGVPAIPVINSANKGATLGYAASTGAAVPVTVTWLFAWLGPVASLPGLFS